MIGAWIGWVGLSLVVSVVFAYWAYTLLGWTWLSFYVGPRMRQFVVLLGVLLSTMVLGFQALETEEDAVRLYHLTAPMLSVVFFAYAMRRQWLIPTIAPVFEPCDVTVPDEELLAVLSEGRAVPLSWLSRYRTVRIGPMLVVHCGLARSLTAFAARDIPHDFAAVLPHGTGFYVGAGMGWWDGVDGRSANGEQDLVRRTVTLCRAKAWQSGTAMKVLYGPRGIAPAIVAKDRVPRVPGARGVHDSMAWGSVVDDRWRVLDPGELDQCRPEVLSTGEKASYYLSRWAAMERGYWTEPAG